MNKNFANIILVLFLLQCTLNMKLCLIKTDPNQQIFKSKKYEQLRSYKPHFIHSFSYPTPVSPLIYYGQVINNRPIFFYKEIQNAKKKAEQIFVINGKLFTQASAKNQLLRRQTDTVNRFMLALQIENMLQIQVQTLIELFSQQNFLLFIFQYEQTIKVFQIFFTYKDEKFLSIAQRQKIGLKFWIRNQSMPSNKDTWKLAQTLRWKGVQTVSGETMKSKGFVIDIEYHDHILLEQIKIHIKEIPLLYIEETKQHLITRIGRTIQVDAKPPQLIVQKNDCASSAVNKLLNGLSYEFGSLEIRNGSQVLSNDPIQLLSFSPSRKRFPWGFLWDDGFHCQVAVRHQENLAISVIKSWLDTILENGWIPRQQNRGPQRDYLCSCPRFKAKDIRDGNPPTLILALDYLLKNKKLNDTVLQKQYWNKIKLWYNWFLNSQQEQEFIFRWHDSINNQGASFTSGLDDYPRPINSTGHVDLQSWMYFFSNWMSKVAQIYGESKDIYNQNLQKIKKNFDRFQDPNDFLLKDFDKNNIFSHHIGYPNLLPLAFGILEYSSSRYNATIKAIKQHLDTEYGLSSISMHSPLYLQNHDAYWRGPVWININYLVLRGLKLYYSEQKQLYDKLRQDLLSTVCGNFQQKGYFYQNYINGKGSFSFPFNGWTSLIAIIQTQDY